MKQKGLLIYLAFLGVVLGVAGNVYSPEEQAALDVVTLFRNAMMKGETDQAITHLSREFQAGPLNYSMFVMVLKSSTGAGTNGPATAESETTNIVLKGNSVEVSFGTEEGYTLQKEGAAWKITSTKFDVEVKGSAKSSKQEITVYANASSSPDELQAFAEIKNILPREDQDSIQALLNCYAASVKSKEFQALEACFSTNFCVVPRTPELKDTGVSIDYETLTADVLPGLFQFTEIVISNLAIKGDHEKASAQFREIRKNAKGNETACNKIFGFQKEKGAWKIVSWPMSFSASEKKGTGAAAERPPSALSLEGFEKIANKKSFVYFLPGDEKNANACLEFLARAGERVKQVLGVEPVSMGILLYAADKTAGEDFQLDLSRGQLTLPVKAGDSLTEDDGAYSAWVITHELTEVSLLFSKGLLYLSDPFTRWIGEGLAEYISYVTTRRLASKQCRAMLKIRSDELKTLLGRQKHYDLTQWHAEVKVGDQSIARGPSTSEGYGLSLSLWKDLIDRHGEVVIKKFLDRIPALTKHDNQHLIALLADLTGEKDLGQRMTSLNVAEFKARLDQARSEIKTAK